MIAITLIANNNKSTHRLEKNGIWSIMFHIEYQRKSHAIRITISTIISATIEFFFRPFFSDCFCCFISLDSFFVFTFFSEFLGIFADRIFFFSLFGDGCVCLDIVGIPFNLFVFRGSPVAVLTPQKCSNEKNNHCRDQDNNRDYKQRVPTKLNQYETKENCEPDDCNDKTDNI